MIKYNKWNPPPIQNGETKLIDLTVNDLYKLIYKILNEYEKESPL